MSEPVQLGGAFDGKTHVLPIRIYYEDTDFSGLVYHASYLRFLERGRSDCLRALGVHHADLWAREEPIAFTVTRMEIDFVRAARIDDIISVRTAYTRASGVRITGRQEIWRGDEVLIRTRVEAACINDVGRPRRLPADVVAAMGPYLAVDE